MSQPVTPPWILRYSIPKIPSGWELSDETLPESVLHDEAVELLKALLVVWSAGAGSMKVVRNLAIRWDETRPSVGVDPDVCVLSPAPPDAANLTSIRTWVADHAPPILAIEVVSETDPRKDYVIAPEKYAASGTGELWVFDPLLCGPASHGGPFRIQVWRRDEHGKFDRVYAGDGPAFSPTLNAYLIASDEGRKLRIANDQAATDFWHTPEESARAATEAARAATQAAERRVAELEAELARRNGK